MLEPTLEEQAEVDKDTGQEKGNHGPELRAAHAKTYCLRQQGKAVWVL